jgi:hypothetical protein
VSWGGTPKLNILTISELQFIRRPPQLVKFIEN